MATLWGMFEGIVRLETGGYAYLLNPDLDVTPTNKSERGALLNYKKTFLIKTE